MKDETVKREGKFKEYKSKVTSFDFLKINFSNFFSQLENLGCPLKMVKPRLDLSLFAQIQVDLTLRL